MEAWIDAIIAFIEVHQRWAFWIALLFAMAETTAFLSILIPSTAILVGVGALVATGGLDFTPIWFGASIGAMIGSTFSYWLGLRYGQRILVMWPLRDHPEQATKGVAAFAKWGGFAIIIGHFFGPLRSVVFLLAGIARMPVLRFMLFNLPGCVLWAFLVPKSGEIGGDLLGALWQIFT